LSREHSGPQPKPVLLSQGVPDLEAMLARHQLTNPAKIRNAGQHQPVNYVVLTSWPTRSLQAPAVASNATRQEHYSHPREQAYVA
jgi:hypothetical protein